MRLSAEILDHIFSFLVSHRETLVACSEDQLLSPIVERHLYYHVTVYFSGSPDCNYTFEPDHFSKLVSENPRLLLYVRILQFQFEIAPYFHPVQKQLDGFAETLLMFPALRCIMFTTSRDCELYLPSSFEAALQDRLNLPTIKEVHLAGCMDFPFSFLNNIKDLSLSGNIMVYDCSSTMPHLESLTLRAWPRRTISRSCSDWVKLHIVELESLKYASHLGLLPQLLGVCLGTLKKLEVDLGESGCFNKYTFRTGEIRDNYHFPKIFPIPPNLQQLTIRTAAYLKYNDDNTPTHCISYLPVTACIINQFASSLRRLYLDLDIKISTFLDLTRIDFSPLAVLGAAIPRIDLYIHTGILPSPLTRAQLFSSLEDCGDIVRSIKEGTLVIHWEKTLPDYV